MRLILFIALLMVAAASANAITPAMMGVVAASQATPKSISGLVAWYDASDASTITAAAGLVSQWDDKSGNGYHATQGTGTAQPATGTATQNGRNILVFDGTDVLNMPSGVYTVPAGSNTTFVVSKRASEDASLDSPHAMGTGATNKLIFFYGTTAGQMNFRSNTGSGNTTLSGLTNTNFNTFVGRRDGTAQDLYANGGAGATTANGANAGTIDSAVIGNSQNNLFLIGSIAEIIFYSRALTNAEMNSVGQYLANKWGLTWTEI